MKEPEVDAMGMDHPLSIAFLTLAFALGRWPTRQRCACASWYVQKIKSLGSCRHWGLWVSASSLHLHSPTSSLCQSTTHLCLPCRLHQGNETQHRLKVSWEPPGCGQSHNLALRCPREQEGLQCGCLQSRSAPSLIQ